VGTRTLKVRARVADPDERARIYVRQKSAAPREIPVLLLDPVA